jgi:Fe-S cluster assembly protein SufD
LVGRTLAAEAVIPFTEEDVVALSERLEEPDWLLEKRLAAWRVFEATPMPTLKDEPWRRTDIRLVHWEEVAHLSDGEGAKLDDIPAEMRPAPIGEEQGGLLTFLNGQLTASKLADSLAEQGVIFSDLHAAVRLHPELVQRHLLTAVTPDQGKFAAMHAALWTHGVFVYVPKGVEVALPIRSLEVVTGTGATLTHILVVLEEGASLAYVHESASPPNDTQVLNMAATELLVGDAANLRFAALQNWGEHVVA